MWLMTVLLFDPPLFTFLTFLFLTPPLLGQGTDGPVPLAAQRMAEHARVLPHLFPELLRTLFEIVLFEECSNQWSLSRPMLSLILVNEQIYNDLRVRR